MRRLVARLVALAVGGALAVTSPAAAQSPITLPPPPTIVPAPPADGTVVSDVLGPLATNGCDSVAVVYALAGPIAATNLPPDLQAVVAQLDPYLSLLTLACGFVVTPPSGAVCASDQAVLDQLGVLGLPASPPPAYLAFYDSAAGIEHAFLRLGLDLGQGTSERLAEAFGCGVPDTTLPDPAALPTRPTSPLAPVVDGGPAPAVGGFASAPVVPSGRTGPGGPAATPPTAAPVASVAVPTAPVAFLPAGAFAYPLLLVAPLLLLAGIVVFGRALSAMPAVESR